MNLLFFFFFNDTATTEIYTRKDTLSLHDALPISWRDLGRLGRQLRPVLRERDRSEEHTSELQSPFLISYAVFCLKKKKNLAINVPAIPFPLHDPIRLSEHLSTSALFFFFNDTATTEIYTRKDTLSLHDALPISACRSGRDRAPQPVAGAGR